MKILIYKVTNFHSRKIEKYSEYLEILWEFLENLTKLENKNN
jgi:hypothetical protein